MAILAHYRGNKGAQSVDSGPNGYNLTAVGTPRTIYTSPPEGDGWLGYYVDASNYYKIPVAAIPNMDTGGSGCIAFTWLGITNGGNQEAIHIGGGGYLSVLTVGAGGMAMEYTKGGGGAASMGIGNVPNNFPAQYYVKISWDPSGITISGWNSDFSQYSTTTNTLYNPTVTNPGRCTIGVNSYNEFSRIWNITTSRIDNLVFSDDPNLEYPIRPSTPTNISASSITTTSADISWTTNTTYLQDTSLYISTTNDFGSAYLTGVTLSGINSFNVCDLTQGTTYYAWLKNRDSENLYSNVSSGISFSTLSASTPPTVTSLSASLVSDTFAKLTWDNGTGESLYETEIHRNTVDTFGTSVFVGSTPSGTTSFINTGLIRDTAYYYWAVARNSVGDSATESSSLMITTSGTPSLSGKFGDNDKIPQNLQATSVSSGLYLTWSLPVDPVDVIGYRVYRAYTYDQIFNPIGSTSGLNFLDTNVETNRIYYYRITSVYNGENCYNESCTGGYGQCTYI